MREQILGALSQYGSPILLIVTLIASIGIPLPITLLLLVAGALVAQHELDLRWAIVMGAVGSILGDQIGYAIGRFGGRALVRRFSRLLGGPEKVEQAEMKARRWGAAGIFFTRWLVSPLGPPVNFACGLSRYSWLRFLLWDALGEICGVVVYIALGRIFSDRVFAMDEMMGDATWGLLALVIAVFLAWKLIAGMRRET